MSESQNIEYKQSWRDEYQKWICGFANAQGGKQSLSALTMMVKYVKNKNMNNIWISLHL